ncbi:MAG: hypothetical protein MUO26_03120 [Methanotrichaceae archaeon]|nr:hypothetical protein [Methanotrichaceae archaeon]
MVLLRYARSFFLILSIVIGFAALPANSVMWAKSYGGTGIQEAHSVRQTSDGGYIIIGNTNSKGAGETDIWLIKTDNNGKLIWDKTFGGDNLEEGWSVEQTTDGYILAGATYSQCRFRPYLIKTDFSGNKIWEKVFPTPIYVCIAAGAYSVQQTTDGGYIIAGLAYTANCEDFYLIKTDKDGNMINSKTFDGSIPGATFYCYDRDDYAHSVQQTSDGGYIVVGTRAAGGGTGLDPDIYGGGDIWLIKTDKDLNMIWDRTFGGSEEDKGFSVQQTSDGGFIIVGTKWLAGKCPAVCLIKTKGNGDMEWEKTFGGTKYDEGFSVQQTSDGGYIIAGRSQSYNHGGSYFGLDELDAWIIKTDKDGNKIWDRNYGNVLLDRAYSIRQTSDGGYIFAGCYQTDDYNVDVLLVKLEQYPPPEKDLPLLFLKGLPKELPPKFLYPKERILIPPKTVVKHYNPSLSP